MSDEFNWPKKGNKAFVSIRDGAYFHIPSIRSLDPQHAASFKEAADIVLEKCEADGDRPTNDVFVLPVMYLYRHGVEVHLKAIVKVGVHFEFFAGDKLEEELACHNLARLWNLAKKLLQHRWPTADPTPLNATEAVINELHRSDPNGQVFRYAAARDGQQHRYENLPDNVNVARLKKTMDGIFNFLDATRSRLEEDLQAMLEIRAELEAEMRNEYFESL